MAPPQKPGRSKQDYLTPPEFLEALKRRLGIHDFDLDLAASDENAVTSNWYTEEDDALVLDWKEDIGDLGWAFCNPPYANIEPWVKKAYESNVNVAMLLPSGTGANWWRDWVDGKCYVLFLNGRLTFVGQPGPYPKDCALLMYSPSRISGYQVWNWREQV